ncbi:unnamed protein product [Urochloa humidicola]
MVAKKLTVPRHTVRVAGRAVHTTVTARPAVARRWLHTALWRLRFAPGITVVGLGVQWTPTFRKLPSGAEPRPATLQLCAGSYCLVLQLARAGAAVPRILRRFLADARVTFAGYNVGSDCRMLRAHYGFEVGSALELRGAAGVWGNASMADMAERLLGIRGVVKSREVATGEWDRKLSWEQVRYVVVDAYLSCCLGVYLRRRAMESCRLHHSDDDDEDDDSDDDDEEDDDSDDDDDESMSSEASSDWG